MSQPHPPDGQYTEVNVTNVAGGGGRLTDGWATIAGDSFRCGPFAAREEPLEGDAYDCSGTNEADGNIYAWRAVCQSTGPESQFRIDTGDTPLFRKCAAAEVDQRLQQDPGYQLAQLRLDSFTNGVARDVGRYRGTGPRRLTVVVHVVYNTEQQKISRQQVSSQIEVLNRDFRARNDVSAVPQVWSGLVADANVEFALATTDPDGKPTDGITYTKTGVVAFGSDDAVKSTARGGVDPWSPDHYVNIWVCKLGAGLLGYAQFPGGPPETDGVVILYTAFGTTGTATAPFNLGRTTTHEVGHYFNLRHIWGDVIGCGGTDFVNDTPQASAPNYGVPVFPHITCNNGPSGDLFVDYMDYVDDKAMALFTPGQVARMTAALVGPRSSLVAAPGDPALRQAVSEWTELAR